MKKSAIALVLILASLALVACGGGDDNSDTATTTETTQESNAGGGGEAEGGSAGSAKAISFEADPAGGLAYTTDKVTAKAGNVTIDFSNPQPLMHDVAIEDSSGKTIAQTEVIAEGTDSTTAELEPGEYTFYCTVPGHREGGMEGTLTVK